MFSRISTVFLFFCFALCACASILPRTDPVGDQCNTGTVQCCNSVQAVSSPIVGTLAGLLGVVLSGLTGQVRCKDKSTLSEMTCSPLSIIGIGGNSCSGQPVCCTGDSSSAGLLVLGCTPINLNL
ncbi:putative hydrophobin [Lyophyllum atratum]|nr:putative hydrophobin [Lyophyllum atratum]